MKTNVVLNVTSGAVQGEDADDICSQVAAKMSALGWKFKLNAIPGDRLGETLEEIAADTDLIIVGGGDGTIAAVAERAIELDIPLAILPLGTMNIFARDLGLPLDLEAALGTLEKDRCRKVDVAYVNEMIFLNSVVLGAFAKLARQRERIRNAQGFRSAVAHLRKIFRELRGYSLQSYEIEDDNRKRTVRAGTIQVTNNPLVTSLVPLPHRKSLADGVLGCYIDHSRTSVGFAKASVQALLGGMAADPTVTSFVSDDISITPKRTAVEASIDGEVRTLEGPLHFQVLSRALQIWGAG